MSLIAIEYSKGWQTVGMLPLRAIDTGGFALLNHRLQAKVFEVQD